MKDWTATSNGPLSDKPYFLRVTKDGKPDAGTTYAIGDGGPADADQRRVVDQSFLDLVRFGILSPRRPGRPQHAWRSSTRTWPSTPRTAGSGTASPSTGTARRAPAAQWEITDDGAGQTLGRAWPLLAGERGEYAVMAGQDGAPYLASMAAAASGSDMIAEQVWDGRAPTGEACCFAGEGTRSATPLLWSHAGLLRLAWTIQRGRPVDLQRVVADRYR